MFLFSCVLLLVLVHVWSSGHLDFFKRGYNGLNLLHDFMCLVLMLFPLSCILNTTLGRVTEGGTFTITFSRGCEGTLKPSTAEALLHPWFYFYGLVSIERKVFSHIASTNLVEERIFTKGSSPLLLYFDVVIHRRLVELKRHLHSV